MDKSITLSMRGLLTTGLVLLALAVAYLIGAGRGEAAEEPSAAPAAKPATRTLTMAGVGTATAVPDQLAFEVSVGLLRDDLDIAMADTSVLMRQVLDVLDEHGVAKRDIQTTGLSMNPVYDYVDDTRVFRGYRVNQQVSVVADLENGGKLVSATVAAGGNAVRVSDLRLQVGDPDAVLADARADAVAQARAKAQEYADATGQELGDVLTLTEVGRDGGRDDGYQLAEASRNALDAAASAPIRAGEDDLVAQVQVVWELQ